jgi:DNA-directed RNA polymerase specialized sigma24 family protein
LIERCRERLPPQPRRALDARLLGAGGVPDRTLAERLGVRLNTFLQNVTRARRLLAECLRSHGVKLEGEGV